MAPSRALAGWFVVMMMIGSGLVWGGPLEVFSVAWPAAGLTDLDCVAVAPDGTVVAGGSGPGLLVSTGGGSSWARWQAPDPGGLRTVAFGGGIFLAIGAGGQPATSPDGIHWTVHQQESALDWVEVVTWSGDRFVAVGGGCVDFCGPFPRYVRTAWSTNGIHWSPPVSMDLYYGRWPDEVAARNGILVAGPYANDDPHEQGVLESSDGGQTWQVVELGFAPTQLTATGDGFFALGDAWLDSSGHRHRQAASSTDGTAWTAVDASGLPGQVEDLGFGDGKLLAVGSEGSWTSSDGAQWQDLGGDHDVRMHFGALAVSGGTVLALGEQETVLGLDGSGWQVVTSSAQPDLVREASSGNRWVAVGTAWLPGMSPILVSEDGTSWRPAAVPEGVAGISDVVWTGERFLAAAGAVLLASDDGLAWSSAPAPQGASIVALARDGQGIVAAGDAAGGAGGGVWWSADGQSWSPVATLGAGLVRIRCNGDGLCVAGGYHGLVASGKRGGTWQERYLEGESPSSTVSGIAWNGSRWVITGSPGIFTSSDGITWNRAISDSKPVDVAWTGHGFLALTEASWGVPEPPPWHEHWSGTLLASPDGLAWEAQDLQGVPVDHVSVTGDLLWLLGPRGHLLLSSASPPDLDQPSPHSYVVPAVAHLDGLNGTHWRSDLTLSLRAAGSTGDADLYLLRSGKAAAESSRHPVSLSGESSLTLRDIVSGTFLEDSTAGAVLLRSNRALTGWSRTFTPAAGGAGSYGQFVPVVDMDALEPVQDLIGLREDTAFRTDLALVNAGGVEIEAHVEAWDAHGRPIGSRDLDLAPYSYTMLTRFLHGMTGEPVSDAWARVRFTPAQGEASPKGLAFASVIDNASGDPTLMLAAPAGAGALAVPVVVHLSGYNGTQWRTDLEVVNTGQQEARFTVEYWPASGGGPVTIPGELTLAPGAAVRYEDVVAGLWGAGGKGTLLIRPSRGTVAATSRTYTLSADGSYGQAVRAVPVAGIASGGGVWAGLPVEKDSDSGFRTSVGFVNLTARTVEVGWQGSSSEHLHQWEVPAYSLRQLDHALAHEAGAPPETVRLSFSSSPPGALPVLGYASIVDNRTGDPVFYPAWP